MNKMVTTGLSKQVENRGKERVTIEVGVQWHNGAGYLYTVDECT